MKNPATIAAKWQRNLAGSTDSIKAGVMSVTTSPTAKAAQNATKYAQRVQESVASGRYQAGCNSVSVGDWQSAFINKGLARIASGASAAQPKMQEFLGKFLPVMDQVKQQVAGMPNNNTEDSLARVRVAIEAAKRYAGKS